MNRFASSLILLFAPLVGIAETISNFNTSDNIGSSIFNDTWVGQYSDGGTFGSIGGTATDFGSFINILEAPVSIGGDTHINLTARLDSGNSATGVTVVLYNDFENYAYANFSSSLLTTNFTTLSVEFVAVGTFDASNVIAFGLSGGSPASTTNFRMSFDGISTSAIPEPSTAAALLGVAAIGFCGLRRRRRVAA